MAKFRYKAKKSPGEVLEGVIEADSELVAVHKLNQSGYFPIWLEEESAGTSQFGRHRIKAREVANFTRQLSELLGSDLAVYNSLVLIEKEIQNQNLKSIIGNIKDDIKNGKSFSDALKNYPGIFSNLFTSLIKSGEAGGSLSEVLSNIADFLDKEEDTRAKIIAAMAYPILISAVGFLTIIILIAYVVPRLVNMFVEMGEILPLPTRMLMAISDFLRVYWFLFIIFAIGAVILLRNSKDSAAAKNKIDALKLKIPIWGSLIRNTELARFTRTLSMLLKNGVPMLNALKITSEVIGNRVIKQDIELIYNDVKAGSSLTSAIKKKASFPVFIVNMTTIGEEGGFLDKALLKAAHSYEIEVDRAMKVITALLEPVFILVMGLIVGFIVVAMLLPVFQISLIAH